MIETPRLILRPMTMADVPALYAVLSDPIGMKHYPRPFDLEKTENWVRWNLQNYETYGFGLWAVVHKQNGLCIGDCGITLQNIDGSMLPEIGYHIHAAYTCRGYATEAAKACQQYAFTKTDINAVYSYMKHSNLPSMRVAEKSGMRQIKRFANETNGISVVYEVTKQEYLLAICQID